MKYTIELEDIGNGLYKAKGFNTLVFDQNGIDKLEPVEATKAVDEFPQYTDKYFFIYCDGDVCESVFSGNDIAESRLSIGNMFRTKEEAEFASEKLKVIAELKKYAEPKEREWDGENQHWCISYDIFCKEFVIIHAAELKCRDIYFKSGIDAKKAIEAVGEDRLKKYYFEVEDE